MANSVYKINKGIGKPIVFKGLKAQWIWYLGGGVLILMIVFAILYILGVNAYLCIGLTMTGGALLFLQVYKLSNKYGEHGLMKRFAQKKTPQVVKCNDRVLFINLKQPQWNRKQAQGENCR